MVLAVPGQDIAQEIIGLKLKLAGDGIFDQDRWLPQLAAGLQFKNNRDFGVPRVLGARHDTGVDYYVAATKLHLAAVAGRNVQWNATVRATKANQLGLLGFGGDRNDEYRIKPEASVALFLNDQLVLGAEYRGKPDNLSVFREDSFKDVFVAYFPYKRFGITAAHEWLGTIANQRSQNGWYISGQLSY